MVNSGKKVNIIFAVLILTLIGGCILWKLKPKCKCCKQRGEQEMELFTVLGMDRKRRRRNEDIPTFQFEDFINKKTT